MRPSASEKRPTGEKLTTIDGVDPSFRPNVLVIADADDPFGVAGVMGGLESEITEATKRVALESATFDGASIRKTSRSSACGRGL